MFLLYHSILCTFYTSKFNRIGLNEVIIIGLQERLQKSIGFTLRRDLAFLDFRFSFRVNEFIFLLLAIFVSLLVNENHTAVA